MNAFALAPEALAAVIVLLVLLWFFEDRIAFNKGVPLGAWKLILKTDRLYYEKRCSMTDVTSLVLQDPAPVLAEIKDELASAYFKELEDEDRFRHIQSTFKHLNNLDDLLHDENFGVQAFVSGSLLGTPTLIYVASRKKDKKTGEPRPFPEGQALVAKRRVLSWSGLIARRLVIGDFVLLPKKQRIEGLFRGAVPVGLLVSEEDSNDRELIKHMDKIAPVLQDVAAGIRTARQYGIIVKDLSQRLKKALSEQKRMVNRIRTLSGESQADKTTTKWYERGLPNGVKITNSFTPVAMFGFPIFGAAVFEYVLHSNAIFGVIVGGSLAMVLIGTRGT